jgi:biotin/lipoyl-binding protein
MLAASALLITACDSKERNAVAASLTSVPVDAVRVRQENVASHRGLAGTLDGFVNAQIQPHVSGYLIQQNYRESSPVAKDQVLFQIDRRQFQAAVDQAAAQVGQAKGQLAQAKAQQSLAQINLKRDTPLAQASGDITEPIGQRYAPGRAGGCGSRRRESGSKCGGGRARHSQSEPGLHGSPISCERRSGPGKYAGRRPRQSLV